MEGADRDGDPRGKKSCVIHAREYLGATSPVCKARPLRSVTQVPTGKVNNHHVNEKGRCPRAVRIVTMSATAVHMGANPRTGMP